MGRPWDRQPWDHGTGTFTECPPRHPRLGPGTRCKHGSDECERCGTSERVDRVHSTEGGVGAVGRLTRKPSRAR